MLPLLAVKMINVIATMRMQKMTACRIVNSLSLIASATLWPSHIAVGGDAERLALKLKEMNVSGFLAYRLLSLSPFFDDPDLELFFELFLR